MGYGTTQSGLSGVGDNAPNADMTAGQYCQAGLDARLPGEPGAELNTLAAPNSSDWYHGCLLRPSADDQGPLKARGGSCVVAER